MPSPHGKGLFQVKILASLEGNLGLGVFALLAVFVDGLGERFGFVEAFGTSLVYFGCFAFSRLGSRSCLCLRLRFLIRVKGVLGAFHQVVGG